MSSFKFKACVREFIFLEEISASNVEDCLNQAANEGKKYAAMSCASGYAFTCFVGDDDYGTVGFPDNYCEKSSCQNVPNNPYKVGNASPLYNSVYALYENENDKK